jgi:hypothetical protein
VTRRAAVLAVVLLAAPGVARVEASGAPAGEVRIEASGADGKPLPCRVHLIDAAGKPVQPPGLPFWRDHFACEGGADVKLPAGTYRWEVERGPEHERASGSLEVKAGERRAVSVRLGRIADLAREGWYSGDIHIHRPPEDVPLLARAEDLHVAPVITWWNSRDLWAGRDPPRELLRRFDGDRFSHVMAGEDEREGGALLYFGLEKPIDITKATREYPSPLEFAARARAVKKNAWIDIEKPFWWDAPAWIASGLPDSIGIANNHMCRSTMLPNEAWGRPRDTARLPDPLGNGWWTQEIYYHVLDCGIRLPPSAGSASGVLPNPVGYNRVYVRVDGPLDHDKWWAGLKAGRSFVTNGPLLLVKANGELPGHVFRMKESAQLEIEVRATLISNDRVPRIEVVKDGRVAAAIDVDAVRAEGKEARVTFARSGWFLVRAVADEKRTFRFASTAPFWVEVEGAERRISKASAEFFLRWVEERIERVRAAVKPAKELAEVLAHHERAREFFTGLRDRANAE